MDSLLQDRKNCPAPAYLTLLILMRSPPLPDKTLLGQFAWMKQAWWLQLALVEGFPSSIQEELDRYKESKNLHDTAYSVFFSYTLSPLFLCLSPVSSHIIFVASTTSLHFLTASLPRQESMVVVAGLKCILIQVPWPVALRVNLFQCLCKTCILVLRVTLPLRNLSC